MSKYKGGKGYDYRRDYFERNKGIMNSGLYICPYCGLPVTKKNAHVDHILPKSKSEFAFNRRYNTVVSHARCNQKKSDKIDYRVIQGYTGKMFGGVFSLLTAPLAWALHMVFSLIGFAFSLVIKIIHMTFAMIMGLFMKYIVFIAVIIGLYIYLN